MLNNGEGGGMRRDLLVSEPAWQPEWPQHNNTGRPVVARLKPAQYVDGKGAALDPYNGLRSMFDMQDRRGNREPARRRGEGGLFRGEEGAWLKRMWKLNVWGERGGGMHGCMSAAASQISDAHYPVGDGWAPLRRPADGWGAKAWAQKGSQARMVERFGRAPAKKGTPVELKPGCWRGGCKFPHGEDGKDDLLHGLPYDGVSKSLKAGRQLKSAAPAKRRRWTPNAPQTGWAKDYNPSPWAGYSAHNVYF